MRKDYEPPAPNQPIAYMAWQCSEGFPCLQTKADLLNYVHSLENRVDYLEEKIQRMYRQEINNSYSELDRLEPHR
jgi:hypothetical protein